MATNQLYYDEPLNVAVPSGITSGDPLCIGKMPGVAVDDRDSTTGYATVDFGRNVYDLAVEAVDDAGNVAVAIGDRIYYTSTDTIVLNKKKSGIFFGIALEAITSGSDDTIMVKVTAGAGGAGDLKHAKALAVLDLSAAAANGVVVLHNESAVTIVKAVPLYTEASSTNPGVVIRLGSETDNDRYYTGTSLTSAVQWTGTAVTLLKSYAPAGDTIVASCAGSKTGTGEVLWCIEYVNA